MTKIYHKTFGVSELDRERDEALSLRMAALSFIQPKHLDIPELYSDEKAWQLAIKELHKINNYKARPGAWHRSQPPQPCRSTASCKGARRQAQSWSATAQESAYGRSASQTPHKSGDSASKQALSCAAYRLRVTSWCAS